MKDHMNVRSMDYGKCVDAVTVDLEACSLQELIDHEKFVKFHVDTTAWMKIDKVRSTQGELESLVKAAKNTRAKVYKAHHEYSAMARTWDNYVRKFSELLDSVDHEVKITEARNDIDEDASKDSEA